MSSILTEVVSGLAFLLRTEALNLVGKTKLRIELGSVTAAVFTSGVEVEDSRRRVPKLLMEDFCVVTSGFLVVVVVVEVERKRLISSVSRAMSSSSKSPAP